jgi:steroid 5-alpha reductase family enzyme
MVDGVEMEEDMGGFRGEKLTPTPNWTDQFFTEDGTISYWVPVGTVFVIATLTFFFCQCVKDNSHIDTIWSWTFIIPNAAIMYVLYAHGTTIDLRTIIMNACLLIWGLRLSVHIGCRHKGEDYRYVHMRERFMRGGLCCYYISAYLYIFILQGFMSLIVDVPVLYTTMYSSKLQTNEGVLPL